MSRIRRHDRHIALASFGFAVCALASGCTPPMPPDVLAARAEAQIACQVGETLVAVPDAFLGSMSSVGTSLSGVCPDQLITEVAADDPGAKVVLTDSAPSVDRIAAFATQTCSAGEVQVVPAFGYPVTIAYNVIGLEGLVLTAEAVAGILSGKVTSFEDPLIADQNPDFDLAGLPQITLLAVETPQGAVEAMTSWLAQEVPQVWTQGSIGTLEAAKQLPTHADLIAEMTLSEATVAVLPIFDAFLNALATANLPVSGTDPNGNKVELVVTTDDVQLYKVGSGATVAEESQDGLSLTLDPAVGGIPNLDTFDLAASKIVLGADQPMAGWPVVGFAHLMVCDSEDDALPRSFAQYLVRLAGQGAIETFGLTPLPEPIRVKTFVPLKVTVSTDAATPMDTMATPSAT